MAKDRATIETITPAVLVLLLENLMLEFVITIIGNTEY